MKLLGTIYFGSWNKKVYAVDAFGNAKWEYETDGAISASPLLLTKNEETHIYIGSGDGVMCVVLKSVESFENITHPSYHSTTRARIVLITHKVLIILDCIL